MTTFALVGAVATAPEFAEIREALHQRGTLGVDAPDVVVADLETGQRTIGDDVMRLARSANARIIVLSREPMVRPVVVVRPDIVAVSPGRQNLCSALDLLLGAESDELTTNQLGRSWWSASVVGDRHVPLRCIADDRDGSTFVFGAADRAAAALAMGAIRDAQTDSRREARLREVVGASGIVAHLAPNADHWLVLCTDACRLWIASPSRVPKRWCLSASLAAAHVSFVRIPAFTGDYLVAARLADDVVGEVYEQLSVGAYDAFATLRRLVRAADDWGFVMEVR